MRVLIVDDEELARRGIAARLAAWPSVVVTGEAADAASGIEAILAQHPDVVFLDIAMPGVDGFAMLAKIPAEHRPLVILVTAHDNRALDAIEVEALDYVLKPLDDVRFARAVERARTRLAERGQPTALLIRDRGRLVVLEPDAIDWVQSEGDYVRIFSGRDVYLHPASLKAFAGQLPARQFIRIHRTAIINVARIASLTPLRNGDYRVLLSTGARLRLSRTRRAVLGTRLGSVL